MTPVEFSELLKRYQHGEASQAEEVRLVAWFDAIERQGCELDESEQAKLYRRICSKVFVPLQQEQPPLSTQSDRTWLTGSWWAAASLLILGCLGLFGSRWFNLSQSQNGQIARHLKNSAKTSRLFVLEDSSMVVLTAGSSLDYRLPFKDSLREVHLTGSGFFDIKRDISRPFRVYSDPLEIQVLGTSFRVKASDVEGPAEVAVYSGNVGVLVADAPSSSNGVQQAVILRPNQRVRFESDQGALSTVDHFESERTDSYQGMPVGEVYRKIAGELGLHAKIQGNTPGCTFSGNLSGLSFTERLNLVYLSTGTGYGIENGKLIVKQNANCP